MRVHVFWQFYRYPWISQEFSDCGLHNGKYTKNQPIGNCVFRACIEFLEVHEKFGISGRKVHFYIRLDV
jgi:hypothetical protein